MLSTDTKCGACSKAGVSAVDDVCNPSGAYGFLQPLLLNTLFVMILHTRLSLKWLTKSGMGHSGPVLVLVRVVTRGTLEW